MTLEDARSPCPESRDLALVHILHRIGTYSLTTKSDDARVYADEIAEAASKQLITTQVVPCIGKIYGRLWKLTPAGSQYLWDHAHLLSDEEVNYAEHYCTRR